MNITLIIFFAKDIKLQIFNNLGAVFSIWIFLLSGEANANYCGEPLGNDFKLTNNVGFGDEYNKSLSQNF